MDSIMLRDYLAIQCSLLAKASRWGISQRGIADHLLEREGILEPEGLDALRSELLSQSKGVLRQLDDTIERSLATSLAGRLRVTILGGNMTVEGDHYEFHGAASGVFGRQRSVSSNDFRQEITEVGTLIADLNRALKALQEQLPPEDAKELRQSRLELEYAGHDRGKLKKALKRVAGVAVLAGDVGAPVIEAVRKVTNALGV